jgi:hypothetical protein
MEEKKTRFIKKFKIEKMNRRFDNPECWTSEGISKQMKVMNRWKIYDTLKAVTIAALIISFVGYQANALVEVSKWEWSNTEDGFSTTQQQNNDGNPFENIGSGINSSLLNVIGQWLSTIDFSNITFDVNNTEEFAARINETLGENMTFDEFLANVENGTITDNDTIREVITIWVECLVNAIPEPLYEPFRIFGKYIGSAPIKQFDIHLFLLFNETKADLILHSYDDIVQNSKISIDISIGDIISNIINGVKPHLVDMVVENLMSVINGTTNSTEFEMGNSMDALLGNLFKTIAIKIGYATKQVVNGFGFILEGAIDIKKFVGNGTTEGGNE